MYALLHVQSLSHIQLFATPWTVAHQASLSVRFPIGVDCHFLLQGNLPDPGIEPVSPAAPALAGRFFTTGTAWEATIRSDSSLVNLWVMKLYYF